MKNISSSTLFIYLLGIVVLFGTLLFRLQYIHLPIDRDEGEFAYAAWRILDGGVPYLDFYNMKMPGIYVAYAVLFLFFGSTIEAIRLGLILINLLNAYFVYRLGKTWKDERTGIFACICYLVFSVQVGLQGTATHAEHVAMIFVLGGLQLFFKAMEVKSRLYLFGCGLLMGLGFLVKQPAGAFALMTGALLIMEALRNKQGWKNFMKSALVLLAGAVLPVLLTAFVLSALGAGAGFKLFAFSYAMEYISYLTWKDGWNNCIATLSGAVKPNLLLWLLVPVSLFMLTASIRNATSVRLLTFFVFSFFAVSAGFYFRPHYFQFLLPAAALLCGYLISGTEDWLKQKRRKNIVVRALPVWFLVLAVSFFAYRERDLFAIKNEEDFIRKIYGLDFFNATKKAGDFIAANSGPESKVAIFGAEPEIWFYSKRVAASGYLYVYPLLENQKFAASMRRQFYDEVIKSRPDILIYTSNEGTWYASPEIHKEMLEWYQAYRDSNFTRIALIDMPYDGPTAYHWTGDTAIHPANPENYFEICKRK